MTDPAQPCDVVVMGASAGGVEALRAVAAGLPKDLPAAVLAVLHIPRSASSVLPQILGRVCALPVTAALDGEQLLPGRFYVAVPNHHLLLIGNRIRLSRGPSENGHRPAVDPLFRSAAKSFGRRVIGVVLSGSGDDGAAGLAAIVRQGGLAVVQDLADAIYPFMPQAALRAAPDAKVLGAAGIGNLIGQLCERPLPQAESRADPALHAEVAMANNDDIVFDEDFGDPSGFGCPACGGSLFEVESEPLKRFRCRIGHAWTADALLEEHGSTLESALWTALRALEEKAALSDQVAAKRAENGHLRVAQQYQRLSEDAGEAAQVIRDLINRLGDVANGAES